MAARLPPPSSVRLGIFTVIAALHGVAFSSSLPVPRPPAGANPITVAIIPLGETIIETPEALAAPAEDMPDKDRPALEAVSETADPEPKPQQPPQPEPPQPEQPEPQQQPDPQPPEPQPPQPEPQPLQPEPPEPLSPEPLPPEPPKPEPRPLPQPPKPGLETSKIKAEIAPKRKAGPRKPERPVATGRPARVKSAENDTGRSQKSSSRNRSGDRRGKAGATGMSRAGYAARVIAEFNRRKIYPQKARRNREQGSVAVSFVINSSGRVSSYSITRSSGNAALDRAVDAMMAAARPPPPPGGSFRGSFVVRFSLDR